MTIYEIADHQGLNEEEKNSYFEYVSNKFGENREITEEDLKFLDRWRMIFRFSQERSPAEALNTYVCSRRPVDFERPELLRIEIYRSFAGEIPIIYVPDVKDFEMLVTNTIYKGVRPQHLSKTGAAFAFGKSTRFIILSAKPYSNVPASELGLGEEDWAEKSMIIRREHECTHYYTKQFFGLSRNCLHDELMADFFGLYEAFGYYRAEYFLRFTGVIGTSGDRLQVYTEGLPERVQPAVKETAAAAAAALEKWSCTREFSEMTREQRIQYLCRTGLEGICQKEG